MIVSIEGEPKECQADFYEREGADWAFNAGSLEVLRVPVDTTASITKAR